MNAAVKATEKDAHGTTDNAQSSLLGQDASAGQESGKQPSDAPSDRGRTESVDAGKKRVAPKPKPKPASKAKPKPEVAPAKPVARSDPSLPPALDRKSVVSGKRVSVSVDLGGRRIIKKKNIKQDKEHRHT